MIQHSNSSIFVFASRRPKAQCSRTDADPGDKACCKKNNENNNNNDNNIYIYIYTYI